MSSSIEINLPLLGAKKRPLERAMNELSFMDDRDDNSLYENPSNLEEAIHQLTYNQLIDIIPIMIRPGNYQDIKLQPTAVQDLFIPECLSIIHNNELVKNSVSIREKITKFISLPKQASSASASAAIDIKTKAIESEYFTFEEDIPNVVFENLSEDILKRISTVIGNVEFRNMTEFITATAEADRRFSNSLILNLILMTAGGNHIQQLDDIKTSMSEFELKELSEQINHGIKNSRDFLSVIKINNVDPILNSDMELGINLEVSEEEEMATDEQEQDSISQHSYSDDITQSDETIDGNLFFLVKEDRSLVPNIDVIEINSYCANAKVKKQKMTDEAFRHAEKVKYQDAKYCHNITNLLYLAYMKGILKQQKAAPLREQNLQYEQKEETELKYMYISGLTPFQIRHQDKAMGRIHDLFEIVKKTGVTLVNASYCEISNPTTVMNIHTTAEGEDVTSTIVLEIQPFITSNTSIIIECEMRMGDKIKISHNKWDHEFGNQSHKTTSTYAINFTQQRQEDVSMIAAVRGIQSTEINYMAQQLIEHLNNNEQIPACTVMAYVCKIPFKNQQSKQELLLVNHLIIFTRRVRETQAIKQIQNSLFMSNRSTILFLGYRNVELLTSIQTGYHHPLPQSVRKNAPCLVINNIFYIPLEELLEAIQPIVEVEDIQSIHYYQQIDSQCDHMPYVYIIELKETTVQATSPPIEQLRQYASDNQNFKFSVKYSMIIPKKSNHNNPLDIFTLDSSMLWKAPAAITSVKRTSGKSIATQKQR